MLPNPHFTTINLGIIKIHTWGLLVAIAFLLALYLALKEAKRKNINKDIIYNVTFLALLGTIIGGRLSYIIGHLDYYSQNILEIFAIWQGGITFYGGFITSIIFIYIYLKYKKISFFQIADLLTPPIILGQIIGRIGCYLSDIHLGKETNLPWAILVDGKLTHPVVVYEFIILVILFFIFYRLRNKFKTGILFLSYLITYAIIRFFLDFLRIEDVKLGSLSIIQYVAILIVIVGSLLLYKKSKPKTEKSIV